MAGWIKTHRDMVNHWIWQDDKYFKWWMTILFNVNYEPKKFPVGTQLVVCNPGQSFRSINNWTDLFSCSKKTTIRFFDMLKSDGMIKTEIVGSGNRRKHLLTVENWIKYQQEETGNSTERVPETPPKEYPNVPPIKKEKKEKKERINNPPKSPIEETVRFNFKNSMLELVGDEKIVKDWMIARKNKKASNTETAFNRIKSEISKSGHTAYDCVKLAAEKGWSGIKAEWITNELKNENGTYQKSTIQSKGNRVESAITGLSARLEEADRIEGQR